MSMPVNIPFVMQVRAKREFKKGELVLVPIGDDMQENDLDRCNSEHDAKIVGALQARANACAIATRKPSKADEGIAFPSRVELVFDRISSPAGGKAEESQRLLEESCALLGSSSTSRRRCAD